MAMTPKLWSISALAVEFGMDRRTVAARLRSVPPAGTQAGKPVWRLPEAAEAIRASTRPAARSERAPVGVPSEFADLAHLNPVDQVALFALREAAYRYPAVAGVLAVAVGADRAAAEQLVEAMKIAGGVIVREVADAICVPPEFDPALNPERFDRPNWEAVASTAAPQPPADGGELLRGS